MITQELTHRLFEYRDGELYWKVSVGSVKAGAKAGTLKQPGYFKTRIDGKFYLNHRLIFLMHHGHLPEYLDHIDNNPSNNRIENLRAATLTENKYNSKLSKNNTSGVKGVSWYKAENNWRVKIYVNGKQKHFGYFEDLELADLVATMAREKYHGAFANHG
jgi:hypothetical protein